MATVTVFNAERMQEIEDGSIVSGAINGSGHLILTRHDGTTVDAGDALVAVPDQSVIDILDAASYNSATPPISYPDGISIMYINAAEATADWTTFAGKWGSIVTVNYPPGISADADTTQTWTRLHGAGTTPEQWLRSGNGADGWSSWIRVAMTTDLPVAPAIVSVITAPLESADHTAYPSGVSITQVGSGSGWFPNGGRGNITTVVQSLNRIYQTFVSVPSASSDPARIWYRTYHSAVGWTPWTALATPSDPATMGITGEIKMWSTNTAPNGWSFCDGGLLDRATDANLFAVIGTTYGVGDGTSTYNKPNFKGRVPVGYDSTQTEFDTLGETGGEKAHTISTAEMPSHTHQVGVDTSNGWAGSHPQALTKGASGFVAGTASDRPANSYAASAMLQSTGGGGAMNILQPYITMRYIIKL